MSSNRKVYEMPYLETPLSIGTLSLKNRLVMPPMGTRKALADGGIGEELIRYYDEKSKGGYIGLIVCEHCYITKQGKNRTGQISVADDSTIDGWRTIATVIHKNNSKAIMQLNHAGSASEPMATGFEAVAPTSIMNPQYPCSLPKELTDEAIQRIIKQFADAARRVREAGFDGVEIHSAHGYLLNQFYSPLTNKRTDSYGGNLNARIKIHLEVLAAVRRTIGDDFPLFLRLGACDYHEDGVQITDSLNAAAQFVKAGVDVLDITGGMSGFTRPGHTEPGYFSELSEAIKREVSVPVILTGGITEKSQADNLLMENKADLIGVGRAIAQDSTWAAQTMG